LDLIVAIDRARSSLELLFHISRELATTLDLKKVLDRVLSLSMQNVNAERGSLIVIDENLQPISAALYYENQSREYTVKQLQDIVSHGLAGWVLKHRKPVLVKDTSLDERWLQRSIDSFKLSEPKSAICVPVLVVNQIVGVLTLVHPQPGFFNAENLALLQAIADLAGIAIHNAQLYESLQATHQRYYELFEDSIYPILITDPKGRILEANRQALRTFGYAVKDITKHNIQELDANKPGLLSSRIKNIAEGTTVSYETSIKRFKASPLPVEIHVQKVKFQGVNSLQWTLRDITEKKELDALREDLAAMIYHDLRAPLANIVSSLDILDTMLPEETSSSIRSIFQITYRSADRMQRLINSLLDINRLETGQPITNKKTVDIIELAQEARDTVASSIESKQQKLNMRFPRKVPPLHVDVDMIRRVMINLLENANKFTSMGGTISFGAQADGKAVKIWVEDNGPGIPTSMQETVFEKFTRLKVEGAPKGVGLGLAFCRLAIEAHGGRIWVESKPGHGSRFVYSLPIGK
jgi:PAS domain S-box-containing protein